MCVKKVKYRLVSSIDIIINNKKYPKGTTVVLELPKSVSNSNFLTNPL